MNILVTMAALAVFTLGIYYNFNRVNEFDPSQEEETRVLHQETEVKKEVIPSVSSIDQENEKLTISDNPLPTSVDEIFLETFKYPESFIVSENETSLELRNSDSSEIITIWYKEKIKSLGMNVVSFITTKTNDKVLNKLVGTNDQIKVKVDIEEESEKDTDIKVSIE